MPPYEDIQRTYKQAYELTVVIVVKMIFLKKKRMRGMVIEDLLCSVSEVIVFLICT